MIVTAAYIKGFRGASKLIKDANIDSYIDEVENNIIKPKLGLELYTRINEYMNVVVDDELLKRLIEGDSNVGYIGLTSAIRYYVVAKIFKYNNELMTQTGTVNLTSTPEMALASMKAIEVQFNNLIDIANRYLEEVYRFAIDNNLIAVERKKRVKNNIYVIG